MPTKHFELSRLNNKDVQTLAARSLAANKDGKKCSYLLLDPNFVFFSSRIMSLCCRFCSHYYHFYILALNNYK